MYDKMVNSQFLQWNGAKNGGILYYVLPSLMLLDQN